MQLMLFQKIITAQQIIILIIIFNVKLSKTGMRILGGRDALRDEFPFVVRLEIEHRYKDKNGTLIARYEQFCTGAALTSAWILTAAHCIVEDPRKYIDTSNEIKVARYNSYFPKYLGKVTYIIKTIEHPAFTHDEFNFDIGLCQSEKIEVSHFAKVSAIDYTTVIGHESLILGFGGTNATPLEKPLQVLKGILIKCLVEDPVVISGLCLVPQCGLNATICGGDSGGPIVHPSGIVGVNSMAMGNCDADSHTIPSGVSASVISVVSPVLDWIYNIIGNKMSGE